MGLKGHQYMEINARTLSVVCCFLNVSTLCEPTTTVDPAYGLLNKPAPREKNKIKTKKRRNPHHVVPPSSLSCQQVKLFCKGSPYKATNYQ